MTQTAHGPDRMLALGSSMFPCVPSGSVLALRRASAADVVVGDIVVFVSPSGLCAHRLLKIVPGLGGSGKQLLVRGDAQKHCETIEEAALVFVVTHVAHRFISYRTRSLFGRALARFARRRSLSFRLVALLLTAAARLAPRRSPPVVPSSGVLSLSSDSGRARPSLFPEAPKSARDSMLRGLKHELRTPLNAILGFADLLLGELDGPLTEDERENVSVVRDAGLTLLGLINEVLDLATALMVPGEPTYENHDVMALLEEVRHEIEQHSGMRPVHVGVEGPQSQLELPLDARALARVLRVLGDIALSATTAGGITLGTARKEDVLHVWIAADGFDNADTLDPEELALGPKRPQDRARRTGALRIAIVSRLLASQGGSLTVQQVKGAHALCVELPLKAALDAVQAENAPGADTSLALSYIASMSHDLRTPLNAILGFADLLTMSKRDAWSHAQLRSLDIVRERAVDLTALIDDMIDWAKLEAGELELQREVTGVLPMVERALAAATERSGGRGLSLSLHLDTPDAGKVWADASRCVQALLGLLENAIRANPGREVQVRLQRTAANVRIEIEDPGLEIRAEDHTGVFDAFRPSYAPTGQRIAGLQLGPSVARSLLRAHGGDVWFESRPGRGTTFTATLPVAAGAGLPGNADRECGRL